MISVCIATYNGEKFLRQQIESILSQLSHDDEIIVSDDCSSDRTVDLLREFKDERIKLFVNDSNVGVVKNFENAIKNSTQEFIFLSDQDDVWTPNKVEVVKKMLNEYDFVSHNANIINEEGGETGADYFSVRNTKYGYLNNLWKMGYLGCCMAFNRKCLSDIFIANDVFNKMVAFSTTLHKLNEVINKVNAQTTVLLTQNDKDYDEAVKSLMNN